MAHNETPMKGTIMSKFVMFLCILIGFLILSIPGAVVGGVLCWLVQNAKK